MAVKGQTPMDAQSSQVPPELRIWARDQCFGVSRIERFSSKNETHSRGWKVVGRTLRAKDLPDGYRVGNVSATKDGNVRMQVREQ